MKQRDGLLMKIVSDADIEAGSVPTVPVVEIAGKNRVLIENHKGILAYGSCEIRVRVKFGCICVQGNHLELAKMAKQQLIIRGCIDSVQLLGGNSHG